MVVIEFFLILIGFACFNVFGFGLCCYLSLCSSVAKCLIMSWRRCLNGMTVGESTVQLLLPNLLLVI
jgi:hypothetical protein